MNPTDRFRRVVVPLDGSPLAEGIIPSVVDLAGPLDMSIVLLRVVPPVIPEAPLTGPRVSMKDLAIKMGEAREYLNAIAADLWERGIRAQTRVRGGSPVPEILAAAREVAADLIAMTTHGRSGLRRLLIGSVAEGLLRQSEIPVLLVRLSSARVRASGVQELNAAVGAQ